MGWWDRLFATKPRAMKASPPPVTLDVYTCLWNEARLLPFFLAHYGPACRRIVALDDGSNDGSLEILAAHFKYDGPGFGKGGTGTLSVDGNQVAQGRIEHTIPLRFSLDETLDVGQDTGTPVVEDYLEQMPFKFTGVLKKVVIELGKSGLVAADEERLKEVRGPWPYGE